jgi:polar amino acid transport system substrate-binding protein
MRNLDRRTTLIGLSGLVAATACSKAPTTGQGSGTHASKARGEPVRTGPDPEAIARLPKTAKFVTDGAFTVGVVPTGLPLGDYAEDNKQIIGVEADIAQLVADGLGRKLVFVPVAWEGWPLGLESGRFDAVTANVTVTEERKKKFDFSTYRADNLGFYVAADSPIKAIRGREDIAGLKIIVGASTNQEKILLRWNALNVAEGKKPAELVFQEDVVLARQSLLSGRVDATFGPNPTAAEVARDGSSRLVGSFSGGWPRTAEIAVATRKDSGFAEAITHALNTAIASGAYAKALNRWNLASEAVPQSRTNPPGLPAA